MKLKYYLLLLILSVGLFSSCMKDDSGDYYLYGGIGTAHQIEGSEFYFEFDNGDSFYPIGTTFDTKVLKDSARVMLSFVLEDEKFGNYDYCGRLQYLKVILTKKSLQFDEQMPDTLGTNEVIIRDGYIYDKYLNLDFAVRGQYSEHEINLVCIDKEQTADSEYINVHFMDKITKGDKVGSGLGIVCFDIKELIEKYPGKKGVSIKTKDYSFGAEKIYSYEFKKDEDTNAKLLDAGRSSLQIK